MILVASYHTHQIGSYFLTPLTSRTLSLIEPTDDEAFHAQLIVLPGYSPDLCVSFFKLGLESLSLG